PSASVPSQCTRLGGMRRPNRSIWVGLCSGRKFANSASAKANVIQPKATQKRVPSLLPPAAAMSLPRSRTAMANPRIEHGIKHVNGKIDQHEPGGHEQHHSL